MATAEIHVTLKPALLDTQGATVRKALHQLGYAAVQDVRVGKFITLEVDEAQAGPQMQAMLEEMCQKLLANPVIEDFEIAIDEATSQDISQQPVAQIPVAPLIEGALTTPHALTNAGTPPTPSSSITGAPVGATGAATLPLTPLAQMTSPPLSSAPGASAVAAAPLAAASPAASVAVPLAPLTPGGGAVNPLTEHSATALSTVPLSGMTPSEQLQAQTVSASEVGTPDPFALDFDRFDTLGPADKMALQELAWRKYGAWIRDELDSRHAAWILCVGQRVAAAGDTLDTFPSDEARAVAGRENGLIPWVFVRPPSL